MNNALIDLMVGLSFYLLPYLTGRIFVKKIVQAWILGALIWFVIYFVVAGPGTFNINFNAGDSAEASWQRYQNNFYSQSNCGYYR